MNPDTLDAQIDLARRQMEAAERIVLWRQTNQDIAHSLAAAAHLHSHFDAVRALAKAELHLAQADLARAERAYDALVEKV